MEEKDNSKDNKKRMLVALAILLGYMNYTDSWDKLSDAHKREIRKQFEERNLGPIAANPERLDERTIQIQVAEQGIRDKVEKYKIVGTKDDRTCAECARWQGKEVTMHENSIGLPTVQDFINDHGFHVNCRCSLQELQVDEIPLKEPNPRRDQRMTARPDIYMNCSCDKKSLFFT